MKNKSCITGGGGCGRDRLGVPLVWRIRDKNVAAESLSRQSGCRCAGWTGTALENGIRATGHRANKPGTWVRFGRVMNSVTREDLREILP